MAERKVARRVVSKVVSMVASMVASMVVSTVERWVVKKVAVMDGKRVDTMEKLKVVKKVVMSADLMVA